VFGIVAGVSGATGGSSAGPDRRARRAIAFSLSMATGAFLASSSEARSWPPTSSRSAGRSQIHPEDEKQELSLFYQLKGIDRRSADMLAEKMAQHPEAMLQALSGEELGVTEGGAGNAAEPAFAAGVSTGLGAIVPVIPFMIMTATAPMVAAAVVSLVAHFLVGAARSLVTVRSWWAQGSK
jgi:VIT1/CCC1 family predicted Fe2+/Mn2+ transporter